MYARDTIMNRRFLLLLSGFLFITSALPDAIGAKEVRLQKGEVYRDRDLTVICEGAPAGAAASGQVLALRECQYWDDFTKKCLFEKIIYTYNNLECVEECQHWDSFNNTCDYQNKCAFYPGQEAFILSTCGEFDKFSRKCLRVREEKIGAGNR